jgi:hypothetical protein
VAKWLGAACDTRCGDERPDEPYGRRDHPAAAIGRRDAEYQARNEGHANDREAEREHVSKSKSVDLGIVAGRLASDEARQGGKARDSDGNLGDCQ